MLDLTRVLRLADWRPQDGEDTAWNEHVAQIEAATARQRERHAAERFARAMELIGDEKLEVRWGGIFALEKMARRSPQDQSEVSEVLATYVRQHAHYQPAQLRDESRAPGAAKIASEIQLIVTVLSRREYSFQSDDRPLDLHNTNLAKAHLPFARLERVFLYNCNLEGALLFQAHLQGAWLARANLKNANLDGAHLEGSDLTDATGMTEEQLKLAFWDSKTTLPKYLAELSLVPPPRRWRR
jgi:hypothetical protein